MTVNNVTRFLDGAGARYQAFDLPAEKISAIETAVLLLVPPEIVFKTIVAEIANGKYVLCVVPANREVDPKKVAEVLRVKKIRITTQSEAEKITGLQAGGISPLALMKKGFKVILDKLALENDAIHISGGQRGLNIRINVDDLQKILHPVIATISTTDI